MLRFKLQLRNIACLSLCHLERSERPRAQARKIAVRMGYGWLSSSLAPSWGEGEGQGHLSGAVVLLRRTFGFTRLRRGSTAYLDLET